MKVVRAALSLLLLASVQGADAAPAPAPAPAEPVHQQRATMGQWASVLAPEGQRQTICYDAVIVGRQDRYANTEALSDIVGDVWMGTRSDVRLSVVSTLRGSAPPHTIWVRLIETSQHRRGATRLFVLRRIEAGHYWAVDWTYQRAEAELLNGLPPPCAP